ncbi:unnamed protein product, partial [Vitis vinifera]|uniref:Uncharacterized protein n=1 Tax=Vitis vinifera TaxID=29760 RepID=D7SL46_VITVI
MFTLDAKEATFLGMKDNNINTNLNFDAVLTAKSMNYNQQLSKPNKNTWDII